MNSIYWALHEPGQGSEQGPFPFIALVSPTPETLQVLGDLRKQQLLPLLGNWPLAAS